MSATLCRVCGTAALTTDARFCHACGSGFDAPLHARLLLAARDQPAGRRSDAPLVGRTWELNTLGGIFDEAVNGAGCIVNITGPAGIGKSRLAREAAATAGARGIPVFGAYCESHACDIPFRTVAHLLRAALEIDQYTTDTARGRLRERFGDAEPEDLLLLDDLLGIRDLSVPLPDVAPDARTRRLITLINSASLARSAPAVYVIEDAHWIDRASESMLANMLAALTHTRSLVLVTYRPEYRGALSRISGAQVLALRPLSGAQASALTAELLGTDGSVTEVAALVTARAAGNPFFAEEMVRDLAERGVLHGRRGEYQKRADLAEVQVPATLQATIGARIDRLEPTAKRTLNAAAVIGLHFGGDILSDLDEKPDVSALIEAEVVDQVRFTPHGEYAFRHPLIRAVAYESQLKSDRAQLHRRLANALEQRQDSGDDNAALIAEHLEAAADLPGAFAWHMRAATWSRNRDVAAARERWRRAQHMADRIPENHPGHLPMRIASRTLLCGSEFRVGGEGDIANFTELRELCTAAGDQRSLAVGMAGMIQARFLSSRVREAADLASELAQLLVEIGDPALTVSLSAAVLGPKHEVGDVTEVLRFARRVIEAAEGDLGQGKLIFAVPVPTAIAVRGVARICLGMPGWKTDFDQAMVRARTLDAFAFSGVSWYSYVMPLAYGVIRPYTAMLRDTADTLALAEQTGDNLGLDLARSARGIALIHNGGSDRDTGLQLLLMVSERDWQQRFSSIQSIVEAYVAREQARLGYTDNAVNLARHAVAHNTAAGSVMWNIPATAALVEVLLTRKLDRDLAEADAVIAQWTSVMSELGVTLYEVWLLRMRAQLARARKEESSYRELRERYRRKSADLGFEGHVALAASM
ncbi:ATP-binding protein [Mycobacterium numidiamassiliense]|uniref:ATP-binding protein n=1 Tax=Mycobacterium numidiamassiliense TaxID=1841861 RepID=UPI0013F6102F|nr:AAA family ATPase [Mycobacterium numidiamassiliense]